MYARQINGIWREVVGNTVFSSNVFQTPESLSDEQRDEFGLYWIVEMPRPALSATQKLGEPGYQINGTTVERTYPAVDKTQAELDSDAARQAAQVQAAADEAARQEARADALIQYLVSHTPAQIAAKVDAEVVSLAIAKNYIAKLAIAVSALARKELR